MRLKASSFLGAVVIFVLFLSLAVSFTAMTAPKPIGSENFSPRITMEYSAETSEFPDVEKVNLNLSLASGKVEVKPVEEEGLLYRLILEYSPSMEAPKVDRVVSGGEITLNVDQLSGSVEVQIASACTYSLQVQILNGTFSASLDKNAKVENLKVNLNSGVGSLSLLTGASLENANLEAASGIFTINIKTQTLGCNSEISVDVGSGGVSVPKLKLGENVGVAFNVQVDSGTISLNDEGLKPTKLTRSECSASTINYDSAKSKVQLNIHVKNGFAVLNGGFPLAGLGFST